eukprot:1991234-Prymnesium_polylepis.1
MVNESDSSAKDDVSIEKYVSDRLGSGSKAIEWACFAFDEEKLYSLDEGLNKARALQLRNGRCTSAFHRWRMNKRRAVFHGDTLWAGVIVGRSAVGVRSRGPPPLPRRKGLCAPTTLHRTRHCVCARPDSRDATVAGSDDAMETMEVPVHVRPPSPVHIQILTTVKQSGSYHALRVLRPDITNLPPSTLHNDIRSEMPASAPAVCAAPEARRALLQALPRDLRDRRAA